MINYFPYDYPQPTGDRAVLRHDRARRVPVESRAPAGARSASRGANVRRRSAAAQPGVPGRRVRLDGRHPTSCRWSRAAAHAGRHAAAARSRGDRRLRRQQRPGAAVDAPATSKDVIHQRDRPAAGRRLDQRRRGHPARVRDRPAAVHQGRRQPRHPGHRRRLQRRRHQP